MERACAMDCQTLKQKPAYYDLFKFRSMGDVDGKGSCTHYVRTALEAAETWDGKMENSLNARVHGSFGALSEQLKSKDISLALVQIPWAIPFKKPGVSDAAIKGMIGKSLAYEAKEAYVALLTLYYNLDKLRTYRGDLKKKKYRLRGRSSETAKAHRG
eukprot:TRINITY_DN3682_c0_g1_i1.p1 TRINITY_DN3682_c0_g1~~TRINITY_DN3682_c0_g1_i1.p1  ORF type:complete len:158 (-),score=42.39 TRINITY_DN3682_c0_g1_i1:2-475(-)